MADSRRNFLKASTMAVAAATFAAPAIHAAGNDKKYRAVLCGCGWWGKNILNVAIASKKIDPVALVDVDKRQIATAEKIVKEKTSTEPKLYGDYREMLDEIKPDIVINATPDHWHALITIAACKAGAHVYLEKPISHTINEGIAMVKAARETDRTVQVDMHRRTAPHHISAMSFLKSGKLGKIGHVRAFIAYPWGIGSKTPDTPIPEGLDWDFYCGPSKLLTYNPRMTPQGYRHFLEFSNGQISDWGTHWFDQILWWAGDKVMPKSVASTGGKFVSEDNSDIPDTQHVVYQFDDFDAVWEHRHYSGNPAEKHNVGLYFYGSNGMLHLGWLDGWTYYPKGDVDTKPTEHVDSKLDLPDHQNIANLWADFIESIEQKKRPICDIEIGHRATILPLLGMLSWKLGRGVRWDDEKQTIPNDPDACKLLAREYRGPWKYPE